MMNEFSHRIWPLGMLYKHVFHVGSLPDSGIYLVLNMVMHTYNSSTWETEAGLL